MAQVTAAMVKELRQITDAPMMECKKALVEADGDIEKAIDVLRVNGLAKAVKKAGRDTNEGTIGAYISEDGKTGSLIEVSCETDFVATNAKFKGFVQDLAQVVAANDPADVEALLACPTGEGTVDDALKESIFVIGENQRSSASSASASRRAASPLTCTTTASMPLWSCSTSASPRPPRTTSSTPSRMTLPCRSSPPTPSPLAARTSPRMSSSTRRRSIVPRLPSLAVPRSSGRASSTAA